MGESAFYHRWLFTRYSWGWDIGPVFGWWLVCSRAEYALHVYVSDDATPPWEGNRGRTLIFRHRPTP